MTLQSSWMQFFNENETRREFMELLQPIRSQYIMKYIYIYGLYVFTV